MLLNDDVTSYLVAPARRHRGIGRRLITEVFDRCGAGRMELITNTAESFYASLPHRRYVGFRLYLPSARWATESGGR